MKPPPRMFYSRWSKQRAAKEARGLETRAKNYRTSGRHDDATLLETQARAVRAEMARVFGT